MILFVNTSQRTGKPAAEVSMTYRVLPIRGSARAQRHRHALALAIRSSSFPSLPFPSFPSLSFPFRSFPFRPSPLRPLLLPRSLPTTLCTTRRYNCILAPLLSVQEPVLSALVPLLLIRGAPATRHYTGTRTATTRTIEPLLRALPPLLRVLEPLHPYYHHCSLVPAPLCCPASPNQDPPRERTLPAHPDQDPPRRHMVHCRVVPCP